MTGATDALVNHLRLSACVVEKSSLRYTPSGLPALEVWLEQSTALQDAGVTRQNQLRLKAIAFAGLAEQLDAQALGVMHSLEGFLSTSRNGKGVVFHIQNLISES